MEAQIEKIKQSVKQKLSDTEYNLLLAKVDEKIKLNTSIDPAIVTMAELISVLDKERIFDHLQNYEIPLTTIEKIFAYYDQNETTN
ncbi:MAG: hypothetical protein V1859_05605 [archaeon]